MVKLKLFLALATPSGGIKRDTKTQQWTIAGSNQTLAH